MGLAVAYYLLEALSRTWRTDRCAFILASWVTMPGMTPADLMQTGAGNRYSGEGGQRLKRKPNIERHATAVSYDSTSWVVCTRHGSPHGRIGPLHCRPHVFEDLAD